MGAEGGEKKRVSERARRRDRDHGGNGKEKDGHVLRAPSAKDYALSCVSR